MAALSTHTAGLGAPTLTAQRAFPQVTSLRNIRRTCVRRLPPCCAVAVPAAPADLDLPPTPVVPSGAMMAGFLLAYRRVLEMNVGSGLSAANAGQNMIDRVRVGLSYILSQPQQFNASGAEWRRTEMALESCLWELERDMERMRLFEDSMPPRLTRQVTILHCMEAARILRSL